MTALLFLSACGEDGFEMPELPEMSQFDLPDFELPDMASFLGLGPSDTASMYFGQVQIKAPAGFCIDRSVSQLSQGFAVMVPCPVLDEEEAYPPHSAFITIQVAERGSAIVAGTEDTLRDLLSSDAFPDMLPGPDATEILETDIDDGAVAVHYRIDEDGSGALSNDVWRLFADVDARLSTISLRGYETAPLTVDDGRTLMYQVLRNLRDANT